jgi:hypothetical protein
MLRSIAKFTLVVLVAVGPTRLGRADSKSEPAKPTAHAVQDLEGWIVHIDQRLLAGPDKELGEGAVRLLANRLSDIKLIVPADKVARLQRVPIWLDRSHGELTSAQYHPSAAWLEEHGYDSALARCVHIPDAAEYSSRRHQSIQPWSILHELAHAYHDQVLGFENAEIMAAWQKFNDSGKYKSVLYIEGNQRQHYGLTNAKEFFAEMTEAFFGTNDFFPFNRAELQHAEPEIYELLKKVWGRKPSGA